MKLIQILALVGALWVAAAAQNTSTTSPVTGGAGQGGTDSQKKKSATPATANKSNGGTSSQTKGTGSPAGPVKLTVVPTGKPTASSSKDSAKAAATKTPAAAASKANAQSQQSAGSKTGTGKNSGATTASKRGTSNVGVSQKTAVIAVKPAPQPAATAKSSSAAKDKKTAKSVTAQKKMQMKVVKTAKAKKPGELYQQMKTGAAGRRDPFVSVIRSGPLTPAGPSCSVGKRCLYIPELVLKGIAKDTEGQMLAVVVSNTHRAYFLRENDQVFNGSVQKITGDAVVFREFTTDHLGRETAHEVVKRIPKS
jgi:hypothetical protein